MKVSKFLAKHGFPGTPAGDRMRVDLLQVIALEARVSRIDEAIKKDLEHVYRVDRPLDPEDQAAMDFDFNTVAVSPDFDCGPHPEINDPMRFPNRLTTFNKENE